jgi:pimeloyl-ACP methyl ester carboxylesterase
VLANREFAKHKLPMPVLGIGGAASFGPIMDAHLREIADDVRTVSVADCGHWVPEEQPAAFTEALLKFLPPAK